MRKSLLFGLAAAVLAATPALALDPKACVRQDNIRNWTALNDKSVVLEDYNHRKVLLKLIGTCQNLGYHEALEIRSPGAIGLSCVEPGDTVLVHGFGVNGRCAVVSVTPYTGTPTTQKSDKPQDSGGDHH